MGHITVVQIRRIASTSTPSGGGRPTRGPRHRAVTSRTRTRQPWVPCYGADDPWHRAPILSERAGQVKPEPRTAWTCPVSAIGALAGTVQAWQRPARQDQIHLQANQLT